MKICIPGQATKRKILENNISHTHGTVKKHQNINTRYEKKYICIPLPNTKTYYTHPNNTFIFWTIEQNSTNTSKNPEQLHW
jgi:hypothetical protein